MATFEQVSPDDIHDAVLRVLFSDMDAAGSKDSIYLSVLDVEEGFPVVFCVDPRDESEDGVFLRVTQQYGDRGPVSIQVPLGPRQAKRLADAIVSGLGGTDEHRYDDA